MKFQYYMDNHAGGYTDNKDGGLETMKFFLNCLCLLLGRLDSKRFEGTVSEFGMNISRILVPQVPLEEIYCISNYNMAIAQPFDSANEYVISIS